MKLLIRGSDIIAVNVTEDGDRICGEGVVYDKHIIPGWQIVDAELPEGFILDGYMWSGNAVVKKNVTALEIEEAKEQTLAALASLRYEKEIAGIFVNGVAVATDRGSQAMLIGAKVLMDLNPAKLLDWKGKNGWAKLNKAAVEAIGKAVGDHVQNCFAKERVHSDAISLLTTIEAVEAYDITSGW